VYVHHISPDIVWHPRQSWSAWHGDVEGTTILHIPRWLNVFMHNIMLHVPHHVDTRIPFYALPRAAAVIRHEAGDAVRERRLRWRDYVRATRRCKLYDVERGGWCGYEAA